MKPLHVALFVVFSLLILAPSQALAGAFGLGESSTVSQGRLHASTARLDEPGALFKNVGGLSLLPGLQISLGAALIHGSGSFRDTFKDCKDPDSCPEDEVAFGNGDVTLTKPIPNLAITYNTGSVTIGFGLYAPYGMTIDWGEDFGGEALCNLDQSAGPDCAVLALDNVYGYKQGIIKRAGLEIPHLVLGAGMEIIEGLHLGVGFMIAPPKLTKVEFIKHARLPTDFPAKLTGDSMGFGGSLGLMYRPNESIFVGAQYKSRMKLTFDGIADTLNKTEDGWESLGTKEVLATITLPDEVNFGLGFQAGDWYIEADVGMALWSLFENLTILQNDEENTPLSITKLDWGNGYFYRAGAEWSGADNMVVRLGAGYEKTPVPDHTIHHMLPDSDRLMGAMGMTYSFGSYAVDLSYTFIQFIERVVDDSTENPTRGTYSTAAHIGGLNIRYSD